MERPGSIEVFVKQIGEELVAQVVFTDRTGQKTKIEVKNFIQNTVVLQPGEVTVLEQLVPNVKFVYIQATQVLSFFCKDNLLQSITFDSKFWTWKREPGDSYELYGIEVVNNSGETAGLIYLFAE